MNQNLPCTDLPCDSYLYESEEEMHRNLSRLCYGDLYVIGRVWVESLAKVLVGRKPCLVPEKVTDKKNSETAYLRCGVRKPSPMGYKELPIYITPHADYMESIDMSLCPEYKAKLTHEMMQPYVKNSREYLNKLYKDSWCDMKEKYCRFKGDMKEQCRRFSGNVGSRCKNLIEDFRNPSPDNALKQNICVAFGTVAGGFWGYRRSIFRAFLFGSLGALSTGYLCYPCQTDRIFRAAYDETGKFLMKFHNFFATRKYGVEEFHCNSPIEDCLEPLENCPESLESCDLPVKKCKT